MKRVNNHILILLFISLFLIANDYALAIDGDFDNTIKSAKPGNDSSSVYEIDERIPRVRTGYSYIKVFAFDLLIPGGGHFYQENYYTGAVFASLKVLGGCALYYYYHKINVKRDVYHDSQSDPSSSEKDILNNKRDFERAHQHVAFAVLGNAALYLTSLFVSYSSLKSVNENSIPTFELKYSYNGIFTSDNKEIIVRFNLRI